VALNEETVVLLLFNDEGISGGGKDEPLVNGTLFDDVNWSSVGAFVALENGFGVRDAVEPNGFVFFGSVTSWSRLTNVLNLSPRKLSGVLREADDDNGLVFIGFELFPVANVGYSKLPPVLPIDTFVYNGEVEAVFI